VFKTWREYFHFSYLNESTLDPAKTYIFVEFPHGVFPMSELIAGAFGLVWGW
jgi:2-acylglycerol O-acyltransferase 2